jgi:hypothetical protein
MENRNPTAGFFASAFSCQGVKRKIFCNSLIPKAKKLRALCT